MEKETERGGAEKLRRNKASRVNVSSILLLAMCESD